MTVRLAKASDLEVTSHIAFRGFSLSPWNNFCRPFAASFPQDVEKSYLREQQEALGDKKRLFAVVETETGSQVMGFAIWNYAPEQMRESMPNAVDLADDRDRSVDPHRFHLLSTASESAVEKCLKGHMELDNMAVDPAHFRKGYGSILCRHGMRIAAEDSIPVGVVAATMGMKLYKALGYISITKIILTDERPGKEGSVEFWIQKWDPTSVKL